MEISNVVKVAVAIILLAVVCAILYLKGAYFAKDVEDAKNNPHIDYILKDDTNRQTSDADLIPNIKKKILTHYDALDFGDILFLDKDNLLGYLIDIIVTHPGADDGEFTLKFIPERDTTTWNQGMAKRAATDVMKIIGPKDEHISGITADIDVYAWYTEGHGNSGSGNVSSVRVGREVLTEQE
ncbi:MAG: hypothetical protein LBQ41_02720 [Candidatus Ancillula sp.]|nr:hypothetical protein [Candidatus Ancillula sp.]